MLRYHCSSTDVDKLIKNLKAVVGKSHVLSEPDELLVYECDGLPQHKYRPRAVVFPASTEETSEVMRLLAREGVPFTPRGAGTGLSGGALALNQGVVIELARMRRILSVDEVNRTAVVQPGVVNLHVSRAVAHLGLHYVPDPSSQPTCTIGGNIAENAGGIHCLKYGTTTDHVLGMRVVLAGGEVVTLGGSGAETAGYDLLGTFVGSEGTFGIATEATLRLVPIPPSIRTLLAEFGEVNDASHAVSAIIAAGVMPAALEMMDREIIRAVEASVFAAGLPLDAGAALLIELDGIEAGIDEEADHVKSICLKHGARACRLARDENERKKLWAARKGAFGAIGRISPDSMIQDAVVPRSRLPEVLDAAYNIAARYELRIANVFHAGDGNLHPLICFDSRFPDQVHRVKEAGRELMETCVRAGGSITGEHGVGLDKRELLSLIFSDADMDTMLRVRAAFDPTGLCNPGKIILMLRGCGEASQAKSNTQTPVSNVLSEPGASATGAAVSAKVQIPNSKDLSEPRALATGASSAYPKSFDIDAARFRLASIVREENITAEPQSPLVVFPGSIEEVCDVMKLAATEHWEVVPAGAMTWLDAGEPVDATNIIISTRKLNQVLEHEPADLMTVTQAGVTFRDLNQTLAQSGQWLPLDPPDGAANMPATIGGVVATGLGGAQQFGYGGPRRHVIGMKVVLADGSLIKAGGRVVKNVAGYDLCKLFTGSYGTLGTIVEVNFKLRPLPAETSTVTGSGSRADLLAGARQIIEARLFPVAVEILSPPLAKNTGWSDGTDHLALIRFAGSRSAVSHQTTEAMALLQQNSSLTTGRESDDAVIWQSLANLPLSFNENENVVWRVGLRTADVPIFLEQLDRTLRTDNSEPAWSASVADGRVRVVQTLSHADNEGEAFTRQASQIETLRAGANRLGSALILEHAPAKLKKLVGAWGPIEQTGAIMSRIKQQLDPHNILSPGRFRFEPAKVEKEKTHHA